MSAFDAVLVPGGGLLENGELPPWVINRLDRATERADGAHVITLSAATTHKPLLLDTGGRPVYESTEAARYLMRHGYPANRILIETSSWDTIGNAYFARVIHTDPAGFRTLLIVNSDFHMARTEVIFRWIFGVDPQRPAYSLSFERVPSVGLSPEALAGRIAREQASLAALAKTRSCLSSLAAVHRWLFTAHDAYAAGLEPAKETDAAVLQSY
jgi:uncharacterized SAM-binding protein YcdF (DUF218 family)